jgi:HlyD family secretion protein
LSAPVIFTIANDIAKMQIDANVDDADVGSIAVDQNVDFSVDAFPYRTFHGHVAQVRNAPITVQNEVTYDTVVGVSNPELKLKPGMTANVSIIVAHRDDVLKISNAALRFRPAETAPNESKSSPSGSGSPRQGGNDHRGERTIYLLPAGAREPRPAQVKLGISDGINTEVLEGLKEGDRVVTAALGAAGTVPTPPAANPFGGGPRRF